MGSRAYVVFGSISAEVPPTAALSDSFAGSAPDPTKWVPYSWGAGSSVAVSSGELQINSTWSGGADQGAGLASLGPYSMYGSSIQVELLNVGGGGSEVGFGLSSSQDPGGSPGLIFYVGPFSGVGTVLFLPTGHITYDPVNHKYLRLRESGGTVYWETSPDGSTWTTQASQADSPNYSSLLSSGYVTLFGEQSSATGSPSTVALGNFNVGSGLPAGFTPTGTLDFTAVLLSQGSPASALYSLSVDFAVDSSSGDVRDAVKTAVRDAVGLPGLSIEFLTA